MTEDIKKIIEANLPAQVGDILKERLRQADENEELLKTSEKAKKVATDRCKELTEILSKYKELDTYSSTLAKREVDISKREQAQRVFEAELRASEAEKRADELHNLVGTVFRSPVFRASYQNDLFTSYNSQNGLTSTTGGIPREVTTEEV